MSCGAKAERLAHRRTLKAWAKPRDGRDSRSFRADRGAARQRPKDGNLQTSSLAPRRATRRKPGPINRGSASTH